MKALSRVWLDTSVLLRLLVGDDKRQFDKAARLVESHACMVSCTVLMESEWVLRGFYKLDAATIAQSLREFLNIENIDTEHPAQVQAILAGYAAGLDFADAVHAHQCSAGEPLMSFGRQFVRRAAKAGVGNVRLL